MVSSTARVDEMAFYSGQKVMLRRPVAFWESIRRHTDGTGPFPGKAYTVVKQRNDGGLNYLEFMEMPGMAFDDRLFRPLVRQRTDISDLKRLCGRAKI